MHKMNSAEDPKEFDYAKEMEDRHPDLNPEEAEYMKCPGDRQEFIWDYFGLSSTDNGTRRK